MRDILNVRVSKGKSASVHLRTVYVRACVSAGVFVSLSVTDVEQVVKWDWRGSEPRDGGATPTGEPRLFAAHLSRQPKIFIITPLQPTF